jgi:4-amino-4-deoxy-L-arabinose transferase-like glycosyltransferase
VRSFFAVPDSDARRVLVLPGVLFLAALIRLPFLPGVERIVNSDDAMTGIMALSILRGEYPVFFPGQGYMGSLEAYATAILFWMLGPRPALIYAVPFVLSIIVVGLSYRLGRDLLGEDGGLTTALALALAPPFLVIFGSAPRLGYIETLVLGTIVLLLGIRLAAKRRPRGDRSLLLILGVVAGVGFWTNWLIAPYVGTVIVLLLRHRRRLVIGPGTGWAALGFAAGSLPFWVFNFGHEFWSFALIESGPPGEMWPRARRLFLDALPYVAGMRNLSAGEWFRPSAVLLGAGYALLLAGWVVARRNDIGGKTKSLGPGMFVPGLLTGFILLSFMSSRYGDLGTPRYLFPLYTALALFVGGSVTNARTRWRKGWLLALPILAGNMAAVGGVYADIRGGAMAVTAFAGNQVGLAGLRPPSGTEPLVESEVPALRPLVEFLDRKGINSVIADYGISVRLTLGTAERIIAVQPLHEKNPAYSAAVGESGRIAIAAYGRFAFFEPAGFEENLRALGLDFERTEIGGWRVYHDFKTAADGSSVPIRSKGWKGWASETRDDPRLAFDRDVTTRWGSGKPRQDGIWYMLDMGRAETLHRAVLLPGIFVTDYPTGLRVEVSQDRQRWEVVSNLPGLMPGLRISKGQPRFDESGAVETRFPPVQARYVRFTHVGSGPPFDWSIGEIFVYSPGEGEETSPVEEMMGKLDRKLARRLLAEVEEGLSCFIEAAPDAAEAHRMLGLVRRVRE